MGKLSQRCEGIVLRHSDYGEADRILSLLTREHGLKKGFARSARNSRKRFGSALEPFTQAIFHWREGRGTLWSLQEAEPINLRFGLRKDFALLALASYGVELVELLLEEGEPQPQIYAILNSFLDYLDSGGQPKVARLLLELRLVYLLGYMPHLLHCSECLVIFKQDDSIRFDVGRGGSLCQACAHGAGTEIAVGTVGSLARSLRVSPEQFGGFVFSSKTLQEALLIFAAILQSILPRMPKSLKFLD